MAPEHSPTPTLVGDHALEKVGSDKADLSADGLNAPVLDSQEPAAADQYPHGLKLWLIMAALLLNIFIVALDQTIIAPATPVLSNEFNALSDIGWYTSAYLMTTTAMQPLYGRLFGLLNVKLVFLSTIIIFEIGSLICAVSHDSATFIVGRAIAGTGLAGGYIGTMIIASMIAPLHIVAQFTSYIGMAYGLGAVTGPIIGGALTSEVSWRWCFWINLPIGGLTIALVVLFLQVPARPRSPTLKQDLLHLDIVGTGLLLAAVTCFLLVCQYGGLSWAWGSSKTIGLIVGAVLIGATFVGWEAYYKDNAIIPLRLLKQRTIAFGAATNLMVAGAYFGLLAFLSVWFQAVQGSSAIRAGVQTLPFICSAIFFTMVGGGVTTVTGRYKIPLILGFVGGSIGAGLLYIMTPNSSSSQWIGFQFLAGVIGTSFQLTFLASQTVHEPGPDRERGGSIVIFFQTLGGCLLAGAAQVIYSNKFTSAVKAIPGIDSDKVATAGASAFRHMGLTMEQVNEIALAASNSIRYTFLLAAVAGAVGFFTAFGMEDNDVRPPKAVEAGDV